MKKIVFLFSLLLGGTYAQAQDLFIGPKAGINFSHAWNANGAVGAGMAGGHLGMLAQYKFNSFHGLQTEVTYSSKGFILTENKANVQLNYLDIPLLFHYNLMSHKNSNYYERKTQGSFFAVAGPQISILMNGKATLPTVPVNDLTPYGRPFDISAVAGIGYKFHNRVSVGVNYAFGLRNVNGTPHEFLPVGTRNGVAQASMSYVMPVMLPQRKVKGTEKTKLKTQKMLWY